jgi:hypothetical protein
MKWIKGSRSVQGNCLQVSFWKNKVFLRDSENPDGCILCVGRGEWDIFVASVKAGEMECPYGESRD